jgi:beta-lactamase class C
LWRDALTKSGEPNRTRPGIVVSAPGFYDALPFELVVPLTGSENMALEEASVRIDPTLENGCAKASYALSWNVQCVVHARLTETMSLITDEELERICKQIASCVATMGRRLLESDRRWAYRLAVFTASLLACALTQAPAGAQENDVRAIVTEAVRPTMTRYGIPGMAVGVTVRGRHYVFNYGVASKATRKPVDDTTLFEIGSITKTFTASLAQYAQITGTLSLSDEAGADFIPLRGTRFDDVRLFNLGTYTAGDLPLQFPDEVKTDGDAISYYQHWKPVHPAGTYRLYSNPSIMLLGLIVAKNAHSNFAGLMQRDLFAPLGLRNTFLVVPPDRRSSYAQGYSDDDTPKRLSPGPLAVEAYGIRTTASDLLHFIDANMNLLHIDQTLRRAIIATHSGYYRVGAMTQDLIWEQYAYPTSLAALRQGNSDGMIFDEHKVRAIDPPSRPSSNVWINKTGSTNGFGAYVAFIPEKELGIVLLANKSYPIEARVAAAYRILTRLGERSRS